MRRLPALPPAGAVALAALLAVGASTAASDRETPTAHAREPVVHTVVIEATSFRPAVLKVRPGDTVVWRNDDMFPHTATSPDAGFDSGLIEPGSSWQHTIDAIQDDVPYVCTYHPTMKGVLKDASS